MKPVADVSLARAESDALLKEVRLFATGQGAILLRAYLESLAALYQAQMIDATEAKREKLATNFRQVMQLSGALRPDATTTGECS